MGQMEALKQQILDLCNSSNLPLECIIFILKDAWRDAEDAFRNLQAQQTEEKKEDKE